MSTELVAELMTATVQHDIVTGYRRTICDPETFTTDWLTNLPGRVFASYDGVTCERLRRRWIAADVPYQGFTCGELARRYLRLMRPDPPLSVCDEQRETHLRIPPALYFTPKQGRDGGWVYLDVRACYWTLLSRHPLSGIFTLAGRRGLPSWRPVDVVIPDHHRDELAAEKPLRNALWGALRAANIAWLVAGKHVRHKVPNRYGAPGLVGLVMSSIHGAAIDAVDAGAAAWLTDAAICRPDRVEAVTEAVAGWGLTLVEQGRGQGHLYGLGDYMVGAKVTSGAHSDTRGFRNLLPLDLRQREALRRIAVSHA